MSQHTMEQATAAAAALNARNLDESEEGGEWTAVICGSDYCECGRVLENEACCMADCGGGAMYCCVPCAMQQ